MIKNIVFDLGRVLIDFRPEKYLAHIGFNEEDINLFTKIIFCGKEWSEYDSSKYSIEQTEKNLIQKYPQYADKIIDIFKNIDYTYILYEMKDTSNYLKELKSKGYKIYILSDISEDNYRYDKQKFDFFDVIEGGVYSFEIGSTKPNKNNYETLLKRYDLIPEETIFIDDRLENIRAATEFGIHGVHFINLESVKEQITNML